MDRLDLSVHAQALWTPQVTYAIDIQRKLNFKNKMRYRDASLILQTGLHFIYLSTPEFTV
jgi:hypothetical protein